MVDTKKVEEILDLVHDTDLDVSEYTLFKDFILNQVKEQVHPNLVAFSTNVLQILQDNKKPLMYVVDNDGLLGGQRWLDGLQFLDAVAHYESCLHRHPRPRRKNKSVVRKNKLTAKYWKGHLEFFVDHMAQRLENTRRQPRIY